MVFWPWSNKKVQPFIKGDADWQGWQPPGSWNRQQPQWCLSGFLTSSSRHCAWTGLGAHTSRQQMKWSESHTCRLPPASLETEHWNLLTCQEPIYANRHRPHLMTAPAPGVARPNILCLFPSFRGWGPLSVCSLLYSWCLVTVPQHLIGVHRFY